MQLGAMFSNMREAGLGWRAFWSLFPYELREQGNCLDDDTVDALGEQWARFWGIVCVEDSCALDAVAAAAGCGA